MLVFLICLLVSLQEFLADIISVLAMTYTETNDCLKYRLLGSADLFTSWGHEYVRYASCSFSDSFV